MAIAMAGSFGRPAPPRANSISQLTYADITTPSPRSRHLARPMEGRFIVRFLRNRYLSRHELFPEPGDSLNLSLRDVANAPVCFLRQS